MKDVSLLKTCLSIICTALAGLFLSCAEEKQIEVYTVPADPQPPESWNLADPFGPEKAGYTIRSTNFIGKASVTLTVLQGDGGGMLANVNRWRKQLALEEINATDLPGTATAIESLGPEARLVDLNGTSPRYVGDTRLVGVIVPREELTWFYKLMGNAPVVEGAKAEFLEYLPDWR